MILTLVLCSASLCEEVGSGNEKYDTSSLESSSWSKFNDATAEPPSCPDTWSVPSGNSCKCGETYYDTVSCDEDTKEVGVLDCYCMTFDSTHNATVLGACFFNCMNITKSYIDSIYHNVPRDFASAVDNNSVCGYLYRTGTLCGQCIDGYYPAVYSYSFDCVPCNDKNLKSNWGIGLDEFVYAFHQYYKDRSKGSMDCRWFAAFYLLMKLGFSVLIAMTVGAFFYNLAVIFTTVCVAVVIVVPTLQERVRELQYTGHGHNVTPSPLAGEYHVPQCSSFGDQTLWEIHILACRVTLQKTICCFDKICYCNTMLLQQLYS